jgi:hypothetical protein
MSELEISRRLSNMNYFNSVECSLGLQPQVFVSILSARAPIDTVSTLPAEESMTGKKSLISSTGKSPHHNLVSMDAVGTVESYYDALRTGEPLYPYFLESVQSVKFGVGQHLEGYDGIAAGLQEQTRKTQEWELDSAKLVVEHREDHAWFSDRVFMGWTDTEANVRYEFKTRWSGTLFKLDPQERSQEIDPLSETLWRFAGMHVSTSVQGQV